MFSRAIFILILGIGLHSKGQSILIESSSLNDFQASDFELYQLAGFEEGLIKLKYVSSEERQYWFIDSLASEAGMYLLRYRGNPLKLLYLGQENVRLLINANGSHNLVEGIQNQELQVFLKHASDYVKSIKALDFLIKQYQSREIGKTRSKKSLRFYQNERALMIERICKLNPFDEGSFLHDYVELYILPILEVEFQSIKGISGDNLWYSGLLPGLYARQLGRTEDSFNQDGMWQFSSEVLEYYSYDFEKLYSVAVYLRNSFDQIGATTLKHRLAEKMETFELCANDMLQVAELKVIIPGTRVPDIEFNKHSYFPGQHRPESLYKLESPVLLVFASSSCFQCKLQLPQLIEFYPTLKARGFKVVLVSLDSTIAAFTNLAAQVPFYTTTDLGSWEGSIARDWKVRATPSYFIINQDGTLEKELSSLNKLKAFMEL